MKRYFWNVLISIDQLANVVLFNGYPDETLSSRMGKHLKRNKNHFPSSFVCKCLDVIDPGHCERSIEYDEGLQAPYLKEGLDESKSDNQLN